jgi:hypothetical protein
MTRPPLPDADPWTQPPALAGSRRPGLGVLCIASDRAHVIRQLCLLGPLLRAGQWVD